MRARRSALVHGHLGEGDGLGRLVLLEQDCGASARGQPGWQVEVKVSRKRLGARGVPLRGLDVSGGKLAEGEALPVEAALDGHGEFDLVAAQRAHCGRAPVRSRPP